MNSILLHYACGSATAEWIREMVAIETEPDVPSLGAGPLFPAPSEAAELQEVPA